MTRKADIAGLRSLTDLRLRIAKAEMAQLVEREMALRQNWRDLQERKRNQTQFLRTTDDSALIAGADIHWHRWVDQQRAKINEALLQVMLKKNACRATLNAAFGRDQAVNGLQDRLKISESRVAKQRSYYD